MRLLFIPSFKILMKKFYYQWKKVTLKIGHVQLTIIFSLLYFLIFVPLGKITTLFNDYLGQNGKYQWKSVEDNYTSLKKVMDQS